MIFETASRQWLSKISSNRTELVKTIEEAEAICQYCEPVSPMTCIERCEIWKAKNELLEVSKKLCGDNYIHNLLNAVKNDRRQKVIEALSEHPRSTKGLQEYLKSKGYYHSQQTIASAYVEPLVKTGLIKKDGDRHKLTLYGRNFLSILIKFDLANSLPSHSNCYEERLLKQLKDGPKSHADLANSSATTKSLSRSLKRLIENRLATKSTTSDYVFYFRTKKVPKKMFSPTEKKIYEIISDVGISARQLSKEIGINLRRTYKYLRRLRKRRLVFTRKKPRTYKLTASGMELVNFLEETTKLILDTAQASTFLLRTRARSDHIIDTPTPLLRARKRFHNHTAKS